MYGCVAALERRGLVERRLSSGHITQPRAHERKPVPPACLRVIDLNGACVRLSCRASQTVGLTDHPQLHPARAIARILLSRALRGSHSVADFRRCATEINLEIAGRMYARVGTTDAERYQREQKSRWSAARRHRTILVAQRKGDQCTGRCDVRGALCAAPCTSHLALSTLPRTRKGPERWEARRPLFQPLCGVTNRT
jgi:hypothetical protein